MAFAKRTFCRRSSSRGLQNVRFAGGSVPDGDGLPVDELWWIGQRRRYAPCDPICGPPCGRRVEDVVAGHVAGCAEVIRQHDADRTENTFACSEAPPRFLLTVTGRQPQGGERYLGWTSHIGWSPDS